MNAVLVRVFGMVLSCVAAAGCGGLQLPAGLQSLSATRPPAPHVELRGVHLRRAPTNQQLAAYYCAAEATRRGVPAFAAQLACGALGRAPTREELTFAFDVELDVENVAQVPIPLVAALVAFRAFPEDAGAMQLGAACVSLCESSESCAQDGEAACRTDEPTVRDLDDFARATARFLVAVARGQQRAADVRLRTVPAGEHVRAVVRLELDVDQMLVLLARVFRDAVDAASRGASPRFVIPFSLEGTVFVQVEGFARFGASFGPTRSEWDLSQVAR